MLGGFRNPRRRDTSPPKLLEHEKEVHEAREAQRETGYKVRWSIGWGELVSWLVLAAIIGGAILLLLHR
jgi:hypothetical protein